MINYEDSQTSKNSIRLSMLNPSVKERVQKFDIGNDGALDIEEAMQGLITLQKQSNNYKKMLWFLIPVICLVLLGTFGSTMLALNLTKEVKSTNGLLTSSKSSIPIRTMAAESVDNMYYSIFSNDYGYITKLHLYEKEIDVKSIYQKYEGDKRTVYINTELVNFSFNQTGEYKINYNAGSESNLASGLVYSDIESALSKFKYTIQKYKEMFNEEPTIEDIAEATGEFRISSSKVPKSYEVHDGVILSKSSRMAPGDGCDSKFYKNLCASEVNYACVSMTCPSGYADCKPVYNGAELNSALDNHGVYGTCKTSISSKGAEWG
jgi:hypothetical protein